jgi:chromosome segregation ATPase
VVHQSLQRSKADSTALARLKSSDALSFNDGLEELERIVADRIGRLKAAVKEGEALVFTEAQRAEQVHESLRASLAELEAKLNETEDSVRRKESANQRTEESLTAKIRDLQSEVKKKEEASERQANQSAGLKSEIEMLSKRVTQLECTIEQAKTEAAKETERVEQLTETSRAKITALETQLRETEGVIREKESAMKALEQDFAAKIQELESQARNKEKLLVGRVKQINDLTTQLEALKSGIRNMSWFFRQTESLLTVEAQATGTALPAVQVQERPTAAQSNPTVPADKKEDPSPESVSAGFFARMTDELLEVFGPMASAIVRHDVAALGESMEKFPKARVPELLELLTKEISDEKLKMDFRKRLGF